MKKFVNEVENILTESLTGLEKHILISLMLDYLLILFLEKINLKMIR